MAVEIFGSAVAPYAAVAYVISFLMTGHRSVYPRQVLSMSKSSSIAVEKGNVMSDMGGVNVVLRAKSITGGIAKGLKMMRKNKS